MYELEGLNPIEINWFTHDLYLINGSVEYYFQRKNNQYPPFFDGSIGNRFCGNLPAQRDLYPTRPEGVTGGQKTLKIGLGGGTPLCPFHCNCCF